MEFYCCFSLTSKVPLCPAGSSHLVNWSFLKSSLLRPPASCLEIDLSSNSCTLQQNNGFDDALVSPVIFNCRWIKKKSPSGERLSLINSRHAFCASWFLSSSFLFASLVGGTETQEEESRTGIRNALFGKWNKRRFSFPKGTVFELKVNANQIRKLDESQTELNVDQANF